MLYHFKSKLLREARDLIVYQSMDALPDGLPVADHQLTQAIGKRYGLQPLKGLYARLLKFREGGGIF